MPHAVRSHIAPSLVQPFAGAPPAVAVVARVAGDTDVIMQLVRHAPRRSELAARRRRAVGVRLGWGLAVLVLLGLFVPLRPIMMCGGGSKVDVARLKLKQYAFEAYPSWAAEHPDRVCPRSFHELVPYMNDDDNRDPWGTPIELRCDPAGTEGVWLRSAGEDRRFDTSDDVVSSD